MRVAILSRYFIPRRGYIENVLSEYLAENNYVRVFTAADARSGDETEELQFDKPSLAIKRLPACISIRNIFVAKGLSKAIENFKPNIIFNIGTGDFFSSTFLINKNAICPIVSVYSDTPAQYAHIPSIFRPAKRVVFYSLKGWLYSIAIKKSVLNIGVTPETLDLLNQPGKSQLEFLPLPYDEKLFYYSEETRNNTRLQLSIDPDTFVFAIVGRQTQGKYNERVVQAFNHLTTACVKTLKSTPQLWILGEEPGDICEIFRGLAPNNEFIKFFPMQKEFKLNRLLNAVDVCLWPRLPGVSSQQSLATGAYCVFPNKRYFHTITQGLSSVQFLEDNTAEGIEKVMMSSLKKTELIRAKRKERADAVKWMSTRGFLSTISLRTGCVQLLQDTPKF